MVMIGGADVARYRAQQSVVVVGVNTDPDAYCSGCVVVQSKPVLQSGNKTLVITSSKFVHGRENDLTVVFWDKTELKATLLRREWAFCLLATDVNTNCRAIDLLEGDDGLDNSRTFMHVPLGHTITRFEFTYAICKSLESYPVLKPKDMVPVSDEFFMVSCNYFGKTSRGVNRLTGAPVFGMGNAVGRTVGIILQDCRLEDAGCEFKVALTASHLLKLILILLDSPEEKNHNLSGGEKRKAAKKNHDLSGGKKRKATKSP